MFTSLYVRAGILAALLAAILGIGWTTYNHIYNKGAASVQVLWDKVEADRAAVIADLKTKAALSELTLKKESENQVRLLNEKNKSLVATVAAITRELQNRPNRPSGTDVPGNTTPVISTGATGKELYRADAEFLIGEAARAETVRNQLEYCVNQYNSVYQESLKFQTPPK
jgi:hypothetical protein